jgi:hypothetical protein
MAFVLPPVGGFVGGDALAAAIASGLADADEPMLLVDFGTNAEIVLAGCGPLIVASAAAGPAFEGAGITCGGPAAEGAVTHVAVFGDGSVELTALGAEEPRWFSGSGIVSAVAELRRLGHIRADGLLVAEGPLHDRFRLVDGVVTVSLGTVDACLSVSQLDVRSLQLAKAAVRAGITAVLEVAGAHAGDLRAILVAGAFGSALEAVDLADSKGQRSSRWILRCLNSQRLWRVRRRTLTWPQIPDSRHRSWRPRNSLTTQSAPETAWGPVLCSGVTQNTCRESRKPRPSGRGFHNPSPTYP